MQLADRARDGAEVVARETFSDIGIVNWLLANGGENFAGEIFDRGLVAGFTLLVGLAFHVVVDLGLVGIGISDALVVLLRDAVRNGGIDADLGAGRHHARALQQAGI